MRYEVNVIGYCELVTMDMLQHQCLIQVDW